MTARIRLRIRQLNKVMRAHGLTSNGDLARRIDMDVATVGRVLNGTARPGEQFIASLLTAFPEWEFSDLFEVIEDGD